MKIKNLESADLKNKIIVVRVDFNVPIENGKVSENTRIVESIPTLKFLLKKGAKRIHILSHLGRPKGVFDKNFSLKVILPDLEKLLKQKVEFRKDFTPGNSKIQLHENVRFHPGEKKNDPVFIQKLLKIKADLFVNDGFAVSHRPHASVIGLASFLPAYPGFLVQKEVENLSPFLQSEKMEGLSVIIGGVKIETKIGVLHHFCKTADNILIGGALANTFLAAQGFNVGKSFYEESELNTARDILELAEKHNTGFHLPMDVICADEINAIEKVDVPIEDVIGKMKILDIGMHSVKSYCEILQHSKIIIWNGPMGCFEKTLFEMGTREILKIIASQKSAKTILGGGDTLEALKTFGVDKSAFSHVSTGGGAMLKFLEGKDLPGIEALSTNN
ncbi:phosphoglycerate kinase [Candidatus Gracilibacteria bacterium]|nr:phosphoglycerate kinase [Candidatus Gracilibacteria bacterium]